MKTNRTKTRKIWKIMKGWLFFAIVIFGALAMSFSKNDLIVALGCLILLGVVFVALFYVLISLLIKDIQKILNIIHGE